MASHNHNRILATTCCDPANPEELKEVEVNFDAQIEFNCEAPILCLSQIDRSIPGQTLLLENRDLYMTLDNFKKLTFANIELLVLLTKQYQDAMLNDGCGQQESIEEAIHVYDLIGEYIETLEASNETN